MEETITDVQLREWAEFFALEPWGSEVEFMRSGIVAAAVVNAAPNRKPHAKPATPKDFMPSMAPKRDMDPKRIRNEFLSVFGDRIVKAPKTPDKAK